jgi:hypothetical protein
MKKLLAYIMIPMTLLSGCATIVAKYDNGSDAGVKKTSLTLKDDGRGKKWAELSGGLITPGVFKGDLTVDGSGDMTVNINELHFLATWSNGWTEGTYNATGKLIFRKNGDRWKCEVAEKPEILEIVNGRIRYYDDYMTEEKGTGLVKNRFDRIRAVNEYLKKSGMPEYFSHPWKNMIPDGILTVDFEKMMDEKVVSVNDRNFILSCYDNDGKRYRLKKNVPSGDDRYNIESKLFNIFFNKYRIAGSLKGAAEPFLFPELFPFSVLYDKKTRDSYKAVSPEDYQIGDSIVWNKKYTDAIFPDHLKELRNTGSICRDFEESLQLFFMEYNLDYFFNVFLNGYEFNLK